MRIGKDTLIKLISFKENECQAVEQYLEEKAQNGWLLEDVKCGFFVFKKSEPKKYKFAVDIFTDYKTGEYREYCEASGWKFISETRNYLIFFTEDQNITPIQTDEKLVINKVSKSILERLILFIISSLYMIRIIYKNLYNYKVDINSLYDSGYLFLIIVSSILVIYPIFEVIRCSAWYLKYKKLSRLGEVIIYPSLKELNISIIVFKLYIYMFPIIIICLMGMSFYSTINICTGLAVIAIIISIIRIIKIAKA